MIQRSFDTASGTVALQVVSAWVGELHSCLGQVAVKKGSNEITAVPQLLKLLELTGAGVTLDALHCQKKNRHANSRKRSGLHFDRPGKPGFAQKDHRRFVRKICRRGI